MRVPEGQAFFDQIVSEVSGEQKWIAGCRPADRTVDLHRRDHFRIHGQRHFQSVNGVEQPLFVLLQVAVIGHGQSLQRGEQADQITNEAAAFAPGEFGHIRVFLLRHQAATGRVRIIQRDERKFCAGPENDVFGKARQMHATQGDDKKQLRHEITIADSIHAVARHPIKT